MGALLSLNQALSDITDRLALGYEMFGDHAIWIWALPPVWGIAASLIWMKMERYDEERDRFYVANAERNLPRLKELSKERSTEVLEIRSKARRIR
jgi:hypothetical protein